MKEFFECDVSINNLGVWSATAIMTGAGTKVGEYNCDLVKCVSIDEYIDEKIDFIKMDIEGAEFEALKGAMKK